jgi:ABC-2 type transport system permease protein
VDYSWFFFCQASSDMVFQGFFGLAVLGVSFAFLGPALLPASGAALGLGVLSFALAFVVQFHLGFLFMQMIFATHSNYGPFTLRMFMHLTFSGMFAPIDFYGGWFGALAGWLPFRHVIYTPCAIYLGRLQGAQVGQALLSQLVWALVLMAVSRFSFDVIRRHLTIQGG